MVIIKIRCRDNNKIFVDCSDQTGITDLLKSEFFVINKVLLSNKKGYENKILQINGLLDLKGLTIRKKKPVFSEEERKRRSERMKK